MYFVPNFREAGMGLLPTTTKTSGQVINEDVVCIRTTLVIGGYLSCLASAIFAIALVFMDPGPEKDGLLRYISEGMENHCGWNIVVMGTSSMAILICHLVAAAHMENGGHATFWAFIEAIGWNIVLGVVDTGWTLHYVGLSFFLVGNIFYHWIASRKSVFGGLRYQQTNVIAITLALAFSGAALASIIVGKNDRQLRACAVSLEFAMLGALTLQNIMLVNSLDRYKSIHLVFLLK
jgi:hypothetical protein